MPPGAPTAGASAHRRPPTIAERAREHRECPRDRSCEVKADRGLGEGRNLRRRISARRRLRRLARTVAQPPPGDPPASLSRASSARARARTAGARSSRVRQPPADLALRSSSCPRAPSARAYSSSSSSDTAGPCELDRARQMHRACLERTLRQRRGAPRECTPRPPTRSPRNRAATACSAAIRNRLAPRAANSLKASPWLRSRSGAGVASSNA